MKSNKTIKYKHVWSAKHIDTKSAHNKKTEAELKRVILIKLKKEVAYNLTNNFDFLVEFISNCAKDKFKKNKRCTYAQCARFIRDRVVKSSCRRLDSKYINKIIYTTVRSQYTFSK